ncbi:uncharacterized protein LOC62_02G003036 [Vanrija pseudolonga]|uniref:Uncharacterized protein n=1 Tax=Vanrija pseudolonga TaxID=143232 RepID=A0AAF1BGZ1_9TREE|nr:hypothetical protein LOC62_02G003036 [Vanrija pseudolonga]
MSGTAAGSKSSGWGLSGGDALLRSTRPLVFVFALERAPARDDVLRLVPLVQRDERLRGAVQRLGRRVRAQRGRERDDRRRVLEYLAIVAQGDIARRAVVEQTRAQCRVLRSSVQALRSSSMPTGVSFMNSGVESNTFWNSSYVTGLRSFAAGPEAARAEVMAPRILSIESGAGAASAALEPALVLSGFVVSAIVY